MSIRMRPIYTNRVNVARKGRDKMSETGHRQTSGATPHSCCSGHAHHHDAEGKKAIVPVCGMTVDPAMLKHRHEHHGEIFHFCSNGCRTKFAADPAKYLEKKEPPPEMPAGTIYTCPMHPEVRQEGPGTCPICGMALEPAVVSLDDAQNHELADMTRRYWIGALLAATVRL